MSKISNQKKAIAELGAFEQGAKRLALHPERFKVNKSVIGLLYDVGFTEPETIKLVYGSTRSARSGTSELLTKSQSDRAFRIAAVTLLANRVFGDTAKAFVWLRRENTLLDGQTPISSLETEAGSRAVEDILIRIDHGIAA